MHIDPCVLYDYSVAATDQVIAGARKLSSEQLITPIRPEYLSPLGLLVHMMSSEQVWFKRWLGDSNVEPIAEATVPDLDALLARWTPLRAEIREFLAALTGEDRIVTYRTFQGVEYHHALQLLIMHVINHSTEHRSQIALYLALHGIDVGNLDFVWYVRTQG